MSAEKQTVHYLSGGVPIMERISGVDCADGRSRTAILAHRGPGTESRPAWVKVRGRTVTGWIDRDAAGRYRFHAYQYRPSWPVIWGSQEMVK